MIFALVGIFLLNKNRVYFETALLVSGKYFLIFSSKTGTCNINPTSGVAHLQQMRAMCSGWTDEDLPLSYELAIPSNASASLLCSSSSGSCSAYFPAGDQDNAKIEIRIRVLDSLKMYTDLKYTIQVNEIEISYLIL